MEKESTKKAPLLLRTITPNVRISQNYENNLNKSAFILSSGRTGTSFLAKFLDAHPSVYAVHEPPPSWRTRMWSLAYLEGQVSKKHMHRMLFGNRKGIIANPIKPYYIESNPYLVGFVEVIGKVFQNPTIVHIVRDPRDYVRSSLNYGNISGIKRILNKHLPFWHADVGSILNIHKPLSLTAHFAGYWQIVNQHLTKASELYDSYCLVRFEDLFDEEKSGISQLINQLDLDFSGVEEAVKKDKRVNKSKTNIVPPWQNWSSKRSKELHDICSPLMQEFGYGQEDAWKELVSTSQE